MKRVKVVLQKFLPFLSFSLCLICLSWCCVYPSRRRRCLLLPVASTGCAVLLVLIQCVKVGKRERNVARAGV
jgi:hypothetical protein